MPKRETYHVTHDEDRWKLQKEGAYRPAKTLDNKEKAADFGRGVAENQPVGELIIHKKDGMIQEERTCGKDPFPPKG